jgi:hypothetical protein
MIQRCGAIRSTSREQNSSRRKFTICVVSRRDLAGYPGRLSGDTDLVAFAVSDTSISWSAFVKGGIFGEGTDFLVQTGGEDVSYRWLGYAGAEAWCTYEMWQNSAEPARPPASSQVHPSALAGQPALFQPSASCLLPSFRASFSFGSQIYT